MSRSSRAKSERIGLSRYAGNLRSVLHFARPHAGLIVLSFVLMGVQSAASVGRIVIILPVLTRVLDIERALSAPTPERPSENESAAAAALKAMRERSPGALQKLDDIVGAINGVTGRWVPESFLPQVPAASEGDAPGGSAAEGEAARSRALFARVAERERYATLITVVLLFAVLMAIMSAAAYGESYVSSLAQCRIMMDVREAVCRRLLDQPIPFFDSRHQGELVQRALGDSMGYQQGLLVMLGTLPRSVFTLGWSLVTLGLLSWKLLLICLLGLPFLVPMRQLSRKTLKRAHRRQQEGARLVQVMLQIFGGIRIVKAYGAEERRAREFRDTDEIVTSKSMKVARAKSSANALVAFINNFLAALLAVGGAFLILRGWIDVSPVELLVFMMLMTQMYQPLKSIVRQNNQLLEAMASIERTSEILALPPAPADPPTAVPFPGVRERLRFEDVHFSYLASQPVLHAVSLEVPRGQTVALVGASGAGKSTICDLLLRFYEPTRGRITIDGRDLRQFQRASLLARVAVVTQTAFLFHTTVAENIRQGKPDATQEEIEAAAKAAFLHDFIVSLPSGYAEMVGEDGLRLSGGQRQRLTIARALVRDPDILILDEATASLDTASERAVQEALDHLREGRTTLVVAHRLSTIKNADRIVVLDQGRIVEEGNHAQLMARQGAYAHLVSLQDVTSPLGTLPGA